jgi:penicillin-insensitive murein endopeptidase
MNLLVNVNFLFITIVSSFSILSCQGQVKDKPKESIPQQDKVKPTSNSIVEYYGKNKGNDQPSKSIGTVSSGSLVNAKLIPFKGSNFNYFDSSSYLNGRAYLNEKTLKTLIGAFAKLKDEVPNRNFCVMECSNKNGGKLFPHRTHQNGLSVDFMMPLIKDHKAYYKLDSMGGNHYWLTFDSQGKYSEDKSISIDFDLVAHHILLLDDEARKNGLKISKVIINTEMKDELYATDYGKKIKAKNIYVVQSLTPLINSLHDDHYHIDFEEIKL